MAGLKKVYQGEYTVYQRDGMYCFLKDTEQDEISLEQSYKNGGQYFFCPGALSEEAVAAFVENGIEYIQRCSRKLLFVWISNPEDDYFRWQVNKLEASGFGGGLFFDFYRLHIEPWESLAVQDEKFCITYPEAGKYGLLSIGGYTEGAAKELFIGTEGNLCGTVNGALTLNDGFMENLDAGIHYTRLMDESEENAAERGFLAHTVSHVLKLDRSATVKFRLTPQSPMDYDRTSLSLSGLHFLTSFATVTGKVINVTGGADAALVFEHKPVLAYQDENGTIHTRKMMYLGLKGSFKTEASDGVQMLCGLSGTESVLLPEASCLNFVPLNPAVFKGLDMYTNLGTTAWVGVVGNGIYYCQPDTASLYAALSNKGLRFLEIPVAQISEGTCVPMLPYRDIRQDDGENSTGIESVLYQKRRSALVKSATDYDTENGNVRAVTPQGVMAEVTSAGDYEWLGFANITVGGSIPELRFENVSRQLQDKFLQKELLCLISKDEFTEANPVGFAFTLDKIGFSLMPNDWRDNSDSPTLLLFRYSGDRTIREVYGNNTAFKNALDRAVTSEGDPKDGYEEFLSVADDTSFQGILAVNVTVKMDKLPSEVQFLMNGVPKDKFYASYLIIKTGKLDRDSTGELVLEQARISALVDYTTDEKLTYSSQPPDYDYLTTDIRIRIQENRVTSFTSSSELLVNRLFDASAKAADNPEGNCLVLEGNLVKKGGTDVYQYSLRQSVGYELSGSGIGYVWIQDMNLAVSGDGDGLFAMSGVLSCNEISGADLLGYGGDEQEGLPFKQLVLRMDPGDNSTFSMEYGLLSFDLENAVLRENSFPRKFAVYLDSLLIENAGETPEQKGFESINAPVSQGVPSEKYQGFVWNISVGSLGGLSDVDGIMLQLLTAFWAGDDGYPQYYVGIKLPDVLSGDGFKLQGIFKLGFASISLEKKNDDYILNLHNFHIEVLGASFPKGSDIFLFSDGKNVGWYAAYKEGK